MKPLAESMRPEHLSEFVGQTHLLSKGRMLRQAIEHKRLHSMIFWGPPGTGKTTLARLVANVWSANFQALSAVFSGVKDIRSVVSQAEKRLTTQNESTILFIDEIHRFNKSQQDAFLPFVESGLLCLIGATTENPSFSLNNALLSRARIYVFKPHTDSELAELLNRVLADPNRGLGQLNLQLSTVQFARFIEAADGDARRLLNLLEAVSDFAELENEHAVITDEALDTILTGLWRRFDNQGDDFYDQISALHKSVRGSDPDAALYWLARMLEAGCDRHYLARRIIRMAAEDIGNADPRALSIALEGAQMMERLGSPEGELGLAQAVIYLASCAKSNATYVAFKLATQDAKAHGSLPVPSHLRNAPTKLQKHLGAGKGYRYAHDEPNAYAAGEHYFPEAMQFSQYYHPVERGLEKQIKAKLAQLKALDEAAKVK